MPTIYYTEEEVDDIRKHYHRRQEIDDGIIAVLRSIMGKVSNTNRKDCEKKRDKEKEWYYVPNDDIRPIASSMVEEQKELDVGTRQRNKKFLELGCGIGIYTILANLIGYNQCVGVDKDKNLINLGRTLAQPLYGTIDLLAEDVFDQKNRIKEADLIYMYSPFQKELAEKFLLFVINNAKVGSHLILATHTGEEREVILTAKEQGILEEYTEKRWLWKKAKKKKVTGDQMRGTRKCENCGRTTTKAEFETNKGLCSECVEQIN